MINLELIDLYLKGIFCDCAFLQNKYQIIIKFSAKFGCTVPQLHQIKSELYTYSYTFPCQPVNGNLIDLNAFVTLVCYFLKLSPSFATCNSKLQGMSVTRPAFLLIAHFCVSMTPFALWLLFLNEYITIKLIILIYLNCFSAWPTKRH